MKISIITLSYNCLESLKRTVSSVRAQSCDCYEHIIVDGASSDGTLEYLSGLDDESLLWSSERDDGIADAFNKGIGKATGDYLFFLNSGDVFSGDVLSDIVRDIENSPVDVLFYRVKVGDGIYIPCTEFSDEEVIWERSEVPHQGAFVHRRVFDKIGGFNSEYKIRMDYDFFSRCYTVGCTHKYIPDTIVDYLCGGASMQRKNRYRFYKEGQIIDRCAGRKITIASRFRVLKSWIVSTFFS